MGHTAEDFVALDGGSTEGELAGPDQGLERSALYAFILVLLVGGAMLTSRNLIYGTGSTAHTVMEAVATILAFIVGALSLVRYYSRKQVTFLLIGCGFLGAAILDLNHVIGTDPGILDARALQDSRVVPAALYMWTWTAGRVFLSLFLVLSLLWGREGNDEIPEVSVYVTAILLTFINLLLFDYIPVESIRPLFGKLERPAEILPAIFFLLAFVGYYRKGHWKRDQFEHWMMISLLISFLTHAAFMAFSVQRWDAMFDAAHLLKIASYLAILSGLMSSVYATFAREGSVLMALTKSNDALAREIEFRAQSEQAAQESSERLQLFLDNANDLIQRVDGEGRFLYVNSAWKAVLGYSNEDLDRMTLLEIVHPDHKNALQTELNRVLSGGEPTRFKTEYVAADGRGVVLSGSSQAQMVGGVSVSTQSILRDVTEQRLAEQRLDESQRNLEALVENTGDSIWSVDRDQRLITLNSAYKLEIEAHTGREPRAGDTLSALFSDEDDVQWYRELYSKTLSGVRDVTVRSNAGRHFELYANPIHSLEGVVGAVFFGKDVTPRHRVLEALMHSKDAAEAANKAKSDFLANMSHELRTPLNSVIGFTNIMLKNKGDRLNDKDLGFLRRVLSNGKHLLALINEVLDLAKVEAGRMELIIEEVDLAHLCVETVQQLEGQAKAKDGDIVLVAAVPESVTLVKTDSAKLKQVIINMVGNALKFTSEGSVTVRLDTAPDGKTPIGISVVDTGIGIPEDRLKAIFEAFQQAEAGTSRKYGGTGLGLALSRSICLLLGYDLMVESDVGKGSTFKIVMGERAERQAKSEQWVHALASADSRRIADQKDSGAIGASGRTKGTATRGEKPDDPTETYGVARPKPPADSGDPMEATMRRLTWSDFKVLVVDDEQESALLIQHFLKDFGCQSLWASTGEEALALAEKHRPDLITLDLVMPGMSGWDVLKKLKAHPELRTIPVVVVCVVVNEGRGKLLGAVDLVTKPFERDDLLRVLWRNLGRKRGRRILLMAETGSRRDRLAAVIAERGLEVVVSDRGELMSVVAKEAPDAVVLDLSLEEMHGVAGLLELRDDRLHTGLPVMAVTHPRLNEKERETVQELATLHSDPLEAADKLGRLLDVSFPLLSPEEARE